MSNIIQELEAEQMGKEMPNFGPGDTVVVQVKVKEGDRERLQAYEGICIAKRNRGLNSSFTVRKISHGEGVERVFQTYSPAVDSVEVSKRSVAASVTDTLSTVTKARSSISPRYARYSVTFWVPESTTRTNTISDDFSQWSYINQPPAIIIRATTPVANQPIGKPSL